MQPSTVYCDACGAANRTQARFCMVCGQAMATASTTGLLPTHSLLKQRYRILYRLGQGGMGAVYKAADTQLGDRPVAVKEMSQKGLDSQEVAESAADFKREALMLAGLFQRNLPRIYDHFAYAGRWYLVMDFIAGETLEEHLVKAGGKLPVEEVLDIGIQLATVLDYLHSHQPPIIFRDLKPTNIMCTPEGDLFLIDFGIARLFKAGQAKDTIAYGSAGYAAPEQYGKVQTTPQSDIYSLGATLHYLLSGADPSQSPFIFAPLSDSGIPAELGELILRMMKTIANERPTSMDEVKQELQRIKRFVAQPTPSKLPPAVYVGGTSLPPLPSAVPVQSIPPKQPPTPPKPVKASPPPGILLLTYHGHAAYERGGVTTLAWSPDGKRIASGSYDKTVQVWNATTGNNLLSYRGHSDAVHAVMWSPDGKLIASGSYDKTVQVWDPTARKRVVVYRGYSKPISAVAWSPDGKYLAFSSGNIVQIWNTTTDKLILTYRKYAEPISAVAWSPNEKHLAFSSGNIVQIWNTTTDKLILTYRGYAEPISAVAWSPDGKYLAFSPGNIVQIWNTTTDKPILTYRGHTEPISTVAWSPDGKYITSASDDRTVQVSNTTDGKMIFTYKHSATVYSLAWSPDGTRIASASDDKTVQVWQAP